MAIGLWALLVGFGAEGIAQSRIEGAQPEIVMALWETVPGYEDAAWPYAYLKLQDTQNRFDSMKTELVAELERVEAILISSNRDEKAAGLTSWLRRLEDLDDGRVPGRWSPLAAVAAPHTFPPTSEIVSLGLCRPADHVAIWSGSGYSRLSWRHDLMLSSVLAKDAALGDSGYPWVNIVRPTGEIERFGIQAWNYADTPLNPGDQVVGVLPLKGQAFPWIQKSLSRLLAHTPTGSECVETRIGVLDVDAFESAREPGE